MRQCDGVNHVLMTVVTRKDLPSSIFGVVLKLPLRLNLYMRERAGGMYSGSMAFWALVRTSCIVTKLFFLF